MSHSIRAAQIQDEEAVYCLACQLAPAFTVNREAFSQSYAILLKDPCAYLHVAESDHSIAGYLLGWVHRAFFANGAVAWVQEIVVAPEERRGKVGLSLMSHFERWSSERDTKLVSLTSKRARDFYRAIGYAESPATYFKKLI